MKILVTPTSLRPDSDLAAMTELRQFAKTLVFNDRGRPLTSRELAAFLPGVDGVVAGLDAYDASALKSADRLRVISRYGAGCDRVDLEAATESGIVVTNTPGANAQAVADLAIGLMLSVARRIPALNSDLLAGKWTRGRGIELYGKTLGIVGVGAIGRAVARRAQGFSMTVLGYDPHVDAALMEPEHITATSLETLLRTCDVVSLHLPLVPQTRHILGRAEMAEMRPGAILINTSRGGLVDEEAAREGLCDGHLGGMGLDVFETEPPTDSVLLGLDQVVTTPHVGAHTQEAVERMASMAIANLVDVLTGRPCANAVTARAV